MLATLAIAAGTSWTQLYTCTATTRTVGEISLCNGTAADIAAGLAITTTSTAPAAGATPPASSTVAVLEFNRVIGAAGTKGNGPLTRSIVLLPGQYLWVQAAATGVSATLSGINE